MKLTVVFLLLAAALLAHAQDAPSGGNMGVRDPEKVHDPSGIIDVGGVRRFFCTGPGVPLMREDAGGKWLREARLFADGKLPVWHDAKVPGNRGFLWAPDVFENGGKYFVYYSVSTFGNNTSAIGLAVGGTLDPAAAEWRWDDRGPVIVSAQGDRFNAIDPAVFRDAKNGALWMSFGSFWDGIHLIELDPVTGLRKDAAKPPVRVATAPEIEAPFIHQHDGFYYLFVNFGKCCRGVESTYDIRVGRSRAVTGPYLDRDGTDLVSGGGSMVIASEGQWIGPGHASIYAKDGGEWLAHHYYDRELSGRSRLRLLPLRWDADGWPAVTQPK